MRTPLYLNQLKRDLDYWIDKGWVDPKHRQAMLDSAGRGAEPRSAAPLLFVLGILLVAAGVVAFVAANWEAIGTVARLGLMVAALWLSFGWAAWLFASKRPAFAQGAVLLGVAIFGMNIMLIGQIFHMEPDPPAFVLLWTAGALLTAWILISRTALALAIALGTLWTVLVADTTIAVHWSYLAFWVAAAITVQALQWKPGVHLVLLSAIVWLGANGEAIARLMQWEALEFFAILILAWSILWIGARLLGSIGYVYARTLEHYGIFLLFLTFFLMQMIGDEPAPTLNWFTVAGIMALGVLALGVIGLMRGWVDRFDLLAGLAVAGLALVYPYAGDTGSWLAIWGAATAFFLLSAWGVWHGSRIGDGFTVNMSFVAFGAEVLYVYFVLAREYALIDTAGFFIGGGILLLIASFLLESVRRRVIAASRDHEEVGA